MAGGGYKRSNSIPSPTWESKDPEGFARQVLSFDDNDDDGDDDAGVVTAGADGTDEAKMDGVLFFGEPRGGSIVLHSSEISGSRSRSRSRAR